MRFTVLIAVVITAALAGPVSAVDVDLNQMLQETQKSEPGVSSFRLVWWMPVEYWMESFKNAPNMAEGDKQAFYNAVEDYVVVAVIDSKISPLGVVDSRPPNELLSELTLTLSDGSILKPLADEDLSDDTKTLFAMMKPLIANMMGKLGQGMNFYCFKGTDEHGNRLLDPKSKTSFTINLGNSSYKWRLPLGCLLPPKYDPETDEKFPGNYDYSPFTGKQLVTK